MSQPGYSSPSYMSDASDRSNIPPDLSTPNNWPLGKVVVEKGFTTGTNGLAKLSFNLPVGTYRAVLETQDRFGKKVTGRLPLQVLQPESPNLAIKIPELLAAPDWELQPGQEFMALWGTGYEAGRAFIEIEQRHEMIQRYWTKPGQTQQQIRQAVTEAMRGGFVVHVTYVRENRAYLESRKVNVPWKNKDFDLKWEHFVSKLQPAQKETWTLQISKRSDGTTNTPTLQHSNTPSLHPSPTPERLVAEMVATLYDESLDAFASLNWPLRFSVFREDYSTLQSQFADAPIVFQRAFGDWTAPYEPVQITYRSFPPDLTVNLWGYGFYRTFGGVATRGVALGRAVNADSLAVNSPAPAAAPLAAKLAFTAEDKNGLQDMPLSGAQSGLPE